MAHSEKIIEAVYAAVDEVNLQLADQPKIVKSFDTLLLNDAGGLDSLTLISLLVAVEQQLTAIAGANLNLTETILGNLDEDLTTTVLHSIATLVEYIDNGLNIDANA